MKRNCPNDGDQSVLSTPPPKLTRRLRVKSTPESNDQRNNQQAKDLLFTIGAAIKEDDTPAATTVVGHEGRLRSFMLDGVFENRWVQWLWEVRTVTEWQYRSRPDEALGELSATLANRLWITILTLAALLCLLTDMRRSTDISAFLSEQQQAAQGERNRVNLRVVPTVLYNREVAIDARSLPQLGLTIHISMPSGVTEERFTSLVLPVLEQNGFYHIQYY